MPDTKGAPSEPLQRTYTVQLDSGHRLIYIASEPITRAEAGKRLREKFRQSGRFVR